jgi:sulfatase maturation enzyme AslB (radical SAM superfamily)
MLPSPKAKLPPIGFEIFRQAVDNIARDGRYRNLILSGAEVTTHHELHRYVQCAASLGWFRKIQIQTNGRRLSDRNYLKHLIDCGVNEFFISMHGQERIHDAMTGARGAFKETVNGLRNLEAFDVNVISNTVLTKQNIDDIVPLMSFLAEEKISEHHIWNFFPMERSDSGDRIVSLEAFVEMLPQVLSVVKKSGKPLVLKGFPECLSPGDPAFFDNLFPVTVLPDSFWREFGECGFGACVHRERCKAAPRCWGLSTAYIRKYGDERSVLSPRL